MTRKHTLTRSAAFALAWIAVPACADITPAETWGDWRGYLEGMGYSVTASEQGDGSGLLVTGIAISSDGGADTPEMTIRLGDIRFVETAAGTVDIILPDTMPLIVEMAPQGTAKSGKLELALTQSEHTLTARGDSTALVYDYGADTMGLNLVSLTVDGVPLDESAAWFSMTGTGLQSQTAVSNGDLRTYVQSLGMDSLAYEAFFKDPEGVEAFSIDSTVSNISFSGTSALPQGDAMQAQDVAAMINDGFAFDGTFETNGAQSQIEITSKDGTSRIKTASATSTIAVAMGAGGVQYGTTAQQVQLGGQLAGLPFPLFVEMAQSGIDVRAPVIKSDEPQDFKLAFNMTDFTMSDVIWALFDPSGQLPREPATLALALTGTAKVLVDGLSPEKAQEMALTGAPPAQVESLSIDRLTLDAVGAQLGATGSFTFDNAGGAQLGGFPQPVGSLNIDLAGANGLIDTLVAMGVLPPEQAMGARMMMGLFAVPGAAADTLKSQIEFNAEGQILANGQRIK